jgi:hypothetical protein
MDSSPEFAHRFDRTNAVDSVCLRCLGIVCQGFEVGELKIAEARHVCHTANVVRLGQLRELLLIGSHESTFVSDPQSPFLM